jgi:hypothetical protein
MQVFITYQYFYEGWNVWDSPLLSAVINNSNY